MGKKTTIDFEKVFSLCINRVQKDNAINKSSVQEQIKEIISIMISKFGDMSIAEVSKDEIITLLQRMADNFHGYITYFEIRISPAQEFFPNAEILLKECKDSFVDSQVFRLITKIIVDDLYLEKVRHDEYTENNKRMKNVFRSRPNYPTTAQSEIYSGNCMASLDFFEDALGYYHQALRTVNNSCCGMVNGYASEKSIEIEKAIDNLIKRYIASGQKIQALEEQVGGAK